MDNSSIARILREIADLLEIKDGNPFKIRAYRNGADIAANHPHDLSSLDETGLREIPGIGKLTTRRLVEHFGSVRAVKQADPAALSAVVNSKQAEAILCFFREQDEHAKEERVN